MSITKSNLKLKTFTCENVDALIKKVYSNARPRIRDGKGGSYRKLDIPMTTEDLGVIHSLYVRNAAMAKEKIESYNFIIRYVENSATMLCALTGEERVNDTFDAIYIARLLNRGEKPNPMSDILPFLVVEKQDIIDNYTARVKVALTPEGVQLVKGNMTQALLGSLSPLSRIILATTIFYWKNLVGVYNRMIVRDWINALPNFNREEIEDAITELVVARFIDCDGEWSIRNRDQYGDAPTYTNNCRLTLGNSTGSDYPREMLNIFRGHKFAAAHKVDGLLDPAIYYRDPYWI